MWFARQSYYPMTCPAATTLRRRMVMFHGLLAAPLVAAVIAFGPPLRQPQVLAESADFADETASAVMPAAAVESASQSPDTSEPLAVDHTRG